MKKILSKSQWLIAKHGVSLVAVFATLVIAFVAIAPDFSFGWFAKDNDVSGKGINVQADHARFDVYYRVTEAHGKAVENPSWTQIDLSSEMEIMNELKAPTDVVKFEIRLVNKSLHPVQLKEFGVAAPDVGDDVPKTVEGRPYYLSTEICTSILGVKDKDGAALAGITVKTPEPGDEPFLRSGGMSDPGEGTEVNYLQYVTGGIVLEAKGGEVIFSLSMTFVNRTELQDVYKNFANDGVCKRKLYFTYSDLVN